MEGMQERKQSRTNQPLEKVHCCTFWDREMQWSAPTQDPARHEHFACDGKGPAEPDSSLGSPTTATQLENSHSGGSFPSCRVTTLQLNRTWVEP